MRLELTNTGFAIRRLGRLATRAEWNGRRDSNSRIEFGRLACFRLHHFRVSLPIFNCQFPIGAVQPKTVSTHTKMPSQKDQSALGNWQSEMLWNSWQDLNQQPRRTTTPARLPRWGPPVSKRRALPFELQEQGHCRFPIVDCRFEFGVKNQLAIANRQLAMTLVGEDRIELSPRVPRTRMLRYTTPRRKVKRKKFKGKSVNCEI